MKDTPHSRGASKLLCIGLLLVGAAALTITAVINAYFGANLASTDVGRAVQGASALTVDVMLALLAAVTGVLWRARYRFAAFTVGLVVLMFATYSWAGVFGFGARERVDKALAIEASRRAEIDTVKSENAEALRAKRENLSWLRSTYAGTKDAGAKAKLLAEISKASAETPQLKVAKVDGAFSDPQAEFWSRLTGIKVETVQGIMIGGLGVLLLLAKLLGFGLGAALWPIELPREVDGKKEGPGTVPAPEIPALVAANETMKPGEATVTIVSKSEPAETISSEDRALVKNFLEAAGRKAAPGATVKATRLYDWFVAWAKERKPGSQVPTQAAFGRIAGELGARRERRRGIVHYAGLSCPLMKVAA